MTEVQCATMLYDESKLPTECLIHSEQQLGETRVNREEKLHELIAWMDTNLHFKHHTYDKVWLLYFLRSTKFRIEKTKGKILRYHTMRTERVEWFSNRDPFLPEIASLLELGVFLPLKEKDTDNRQVFIIRTAAHDPKTHTQDNVLKVGKMLLDLVLHFDETISIYGLVAIFDMKDVTLGHALQLPPTLIKRLVESWESYPCLIKNLKFVNAPVYINAVLNTFRFFMTSKMRARLFVGKVKSTSDESILPKDLGGNGDSYKELAAYWKEKAEENSQWFRDMEERKQPTHIYGDSLKQQVEDRLKFYESGETPRKNIEVMKEAMGLVAAETPSVVSSEKKKKKKKRKLDESNGLNETNGNDTTMEQLNGTTENGNGTENGEGKKKKKKKKNKSQDD